MALVMVLGTLFLAVSCGTGEDDPAQSTAADTPAESETEQPLAYDSVEKQKFDREFNIMSRDDIIEDFEIEDLTGDLLDDLLYERNARIATDFEIEFSYYQLSYDQVNTTLNTQSTSGSDDYDFYIGHKYSFGTCAQNNYCYNLGDITEIDLTQPWWDQSCYDNMTVNGRTYVMTGDIFPSSMLFSSCLVFNRKMVKELGKSDAELFELARNGGWTMDAMYDYCKDVTFDLNGDGKLAYTDDRYCLTSWMMDVPFSMYYACGENFVTIVDGTPELSYDTEKVIGIYDKIYKIIVEQNVCKEAMRKGTPETVVATAAYSSDMEPVEVYFRCKIRQVWNKGEQPRLFCRFSYSKDGKKFQELGEEFEAQAGHWIGAKIGYFVDAEIHKNDGGWMDVDWFRVTKK